MTIAGRVIAGLVFGAVIGAASVASAGGWGAIAVDYRGDPSSTVYGIGRGGDVGEAGRAATSLCVKAGGNNCRVVVSYTQCGAFAAGTSNVGWGMAMDKGTAEANARAGCGSSSCRVVVSDCTD